MPDLLDELPMELLLALRDALADPTEEGRMRAEARARDAGFYLHCAGVVVRRPIEMEPAPEGVEGFDLRFNAGRDEG